MSRLSALVARLVSLFAATVLVVVWLVSGAPSAGAITGTTGYYYPPTTTTADQSMVFVRSVSGVKQVFKADQNLSHVTQLTFGYYDSSAPSMNTARTVITYTTMNAYKHLALMAMNADGTNQHAVVSDSIYNYWAPSISPDGTRAVVVSNRASGSELFTASLSTGALTQLTFLSTAEGNNWAPAWSPNGYYIAFTSDRANVVNIWLEKATGGPAQKVTYDGNADNAAWSPNSQSIAYDFLPYGASLREVYWADAFSVNVVHRVSAADGTSHTDPSWSPDASAVAFVSSSAYGTTIKVAGANGGNDRTVLNPGFQPNWGFPLQGPVAQQ